MEQPSDALIKGTSYERGFLLEEANENILKNLVALRRMLWDLRAQVCQLETVLAESQAIKHDTDCLQAELDSTAERLSWQLMRFGKD